MERPISFKTVTVEFRDGIWVVRVINDDERSEREFSMEAHASSYADDERMRLGIYVP